MHALFMVGEQRSGSNLLRLMLGQSDEIAAPHPPHILQRRMPLMPLYGDLEDPESSAVLVDDVCRLVELNPVPWESITTFDREEDIHIIESVAGDCLDALGYARVAVKAGQESHFDDNQVAHFQAINRTLLQQCQVNTDPDDLMRRQRQQRVLDEIQARGPLPAVAVPALP